MEGSENEDICIKQESSENKKTFQHLWKIGHEIATICPAASRYYMFNLERLLIDDTTLKLNGAKKHSFCHHCGSLWSPENLKVKIQPVPRKNGHIKKLLKWETHQPWKLNSKQKRNLKQFKEATSKIIYTCLICKKTTKYPGFKRKVQYDSKRNLLYTLPSTSIKTKKADVNAGLFIATSKKNEISDEKVEEPNKEFSDGAETLDINNFCNDNKLKNSKNIFTSTPNSASHKLATLRKSNNYQTGKQLIPLNTPTSEKISSNKKKKKSLLAQILKQEEAQKKKTSLSSFLVSL